MTVGVLVWLFLVFSFGLFSFISRGKHLLSMLLSLEYLVLSIYLLLFFYLCLGMLNVYFSLVFLTFSVCEGALGLSILVSLIRSHGNDYFQSFSVLQC